MNAREPQPYPRVKWEYKTAQVGCYGFEPSIEAFNSYGADGWECCGMSAAGDTQIAILFKRMLP